MEACLRDNICRRAPNCGTQGATGVDLPSAVSALDSSLLARPGRFSRRPNIFISFFVYVFSFLPLSLIHEQRS